MRVSWPFARATILGELVGFSLVGLLALALFRGEEPGPVLLLVFSLLAAGLEGGALAYAQWRVLRRRFPIGLGAWAFATILPAAIAYAAGMLAGPALGSSGWPVAAILSVAIPLAFGMGALLGVGQWLALRPHAPGASAWIPASALGWTGGLALSVGGVSLASDLGSPVAIVVGSALSGAAMGAFVGIVLGGAYARLSAPAPGFDRA